MKNEKSSDGHSFKDYFKRATSHIVILTILSQGSMYSYKLSAELTKRSKDVYTMAFLYPLLYRLLKLGYVFRERQEITKGNRIRNYYAITPKGRAYLERISGEFEEMLEAVRRIQNYSEEEVK